MAKNKPMPAFNSEVKPVELTSEPDVIVQAPPEKLAEKEPENEAAIELELKEEELQAEVMKRVKANGGKLDIGTVDCLLNALRGTVGNGVASGATFAVPEGFKLVPSAPTQEEISKAESDAIRKNFEKNSQVLSQEAADKMFATGSNLYSVHLPDKCGHPTLLIRGDMEVDAIGRYNAVCGITSTEKKHQVNLVGKA